MRKQMKRAVAMGLAAVLSCSSLLNTVTYAADGWMESQVPANPVLEILRSFTFSEAANAMAIAAGQVPTGLSHDYTFTHKQNGGKEPFAYGKWWLGNYRGKAVKDAKIPLSSDRTKTVTVDCSKLANHYLSCIQMHNNTMPGNEMIQPANQKPHLAIFSTQFFAYEAYTPTTNPADYPQYITGHMSDVEAMKFYLLLMTQLHSYEVSGGEGALKDDRDQTAASMVIYEFTRCMEDGYFTGKQTTAIADWEKVKSRIRGDLSSFYNASLIDTATDNNMQGWFTKSWNNAWFMSQFTYKVNDSKMMVSIPVSDPVIGTDGKYHRTWDYSSVQAQNSVAALYNTGIGLKKGSQLPEGVTFTNQDMKLDFAADSAEALSDDMFKGVSFTSSALGGNSEIQPGGIINGRSAAVSIDADSIKAGNEGQPMFASFMVEVELKISHKEEDDDDHGGGGGGHDEPIPIKRYKHTELFNADYVVNLRKFDSETGKPLADSHFDILEAFPDADEQLGATDLESPENWQNDSGSQFNKWTGWDAGPGNDEAGDGEDPCTLDDNVTNDDGLLTYTGSGETAHTDTKTYTYVKGYCGGHPAKPEPEEDPETHEIENQDEIDAWEEEVETCKKLIAESNTGYYCATAENGYEDGEDADGAQSKKEMEDDRDKFYAQFISLKYDYSAKEIKARAGYTIHDAHTDDIPIEKKTVTSSQYKDFNSSCNGDAAKLPHQATAAASSGTGGSGGDGGDTDEGGEDEESLIVSEKPIVTDEEDDNTTVSTPSDAEKYTEIKFGEEEDPPENRYLGYISSIEPSETVLDEDEDDKDAAEAYIPDGELMNDVSGTRKAVIATSSSADPDMIATASDAVPQEAKESFLQALYEDVRELTRHFYEMLRGAVERAIALFASNDENGGASHPVRDSVVWLDDTQGNYVKPLTNDIVDHTFTVFDHRTEGEIHINKRDLDLRKSEKNGTAYDAYADENGDGTLEGAVYGLFAAQDIEHPDGHTGTVYQKDDLLAMATTDRNGDASFMTFTEAPGSTYDYETGSVIRRGDQPFGGPDNLHKPQADGDAVSEDNESYVGHDSQNAEMSLEDSETGDKTVYYKHSSNQDGIEGLEGGHEVYPILNNEENNGNCWIGRPLIAADSGSQYYVKELSRSEGYELSVSGKAEFITNGKDSWKNEASPMDVKVGKVSYLAEKNALNADITGTNVDRDVTLRVKTSEGASFASVYTTTEEYKDKESVMTPVEKPVIPASGTYVTLNNSSIEATVGMTVTVNGKAYTVTQVSDPVQEAIGVQPANTKIYGVVEKSTLGTSNLDDFKNVFNSELLNIGYKTPEDNAPWIRVPMKGSSDTDWIGAVNSAMRDNGLLFFNSIRITDFISDGGITYAIVRYDNATKKKVDTCVYNTEKDSLYVKQDTGNGYFIYVEVPVNSTLVQSVSRNESGFIKTASLKKFTVSCNAAYPAELPTSYTMNVAVPKTYWVYDGKMQMFTNEGDLATYTDYEITERTVTRTREVETLTDLPSTYENGYYTVTIPKEMFDKGDTVHLTIRSDGKGNFMAPIALWNTSISWSPADAGENSYIQNVTLTYPGEKTVYESGSTTEKPVEVNERSLRQKIRIDKDIQKLKESKHVWYCLNCGYENEESDVLCGFCGHNRTTEETKTIDYAHDTYGAVHNENISADREDGWYDTVKDWFAKLLKLENKDESTESIGNFRFKAYLKSNLERLYRKADGTITWVDRNGNEMVPQYEDKAGDDGNYDTFTWKYTTAFDGKTVDFPEKDKASADGTLESSNVQKIYTEVEHNKDSMTSSARANNVWASYGTPQGGNTTDVGDIQGYTTSERGTSGEAVKDNSSLYSYNGKLVDADRSDKLNDTANSGYTRILESTLTTIEDEGTTREVETYNYEKFFDAIHAANTDVWDDDMHSTYTGDAMKNYPGQHWFETFYEKYQKDDTDPDHTRANTDGADKDNTAGGDKDTSFKPFRWIRENVFGYRDGYEKYPADNNGVNTEVTANTSDFARANAEASDAVRQFAVKWYLQDEAAKLMVDNGQGENVALKGGTIGYDEAVYDEALFNAIAKAYNYLKPFYFYDLDTIYSVEWDSAKDGGADKDYTTLSADELHNSTYYNTSSYLPYGVYVIVEQQPERRDKDVNDWKNRSYDIEKPKEVIVPSVYDAEQSNDTSDNYDPHYNFDTDMSLQKQARASNYLIRFGEELSDNTANQDERESVIRAHGYYGDFEVYKYGLDIDKLSGTITDPSNGAYSYHGWELRQGFRDPLKDYYENDHRGEAGVDEIGAERGGNNESKYHGYEQENGNGVDTANGETYDGDTLRKRFFYASVSEDDGTADNVLYKDGAKDDNNASGMNWKDGIPSTTGELTAYDKLYSAALVPWSVTAPADLDVYSSKDFTGYADVKERNNYSVSYLRINKVDSETGEYILHDDAVFGLYAASRYTSFDEIEEDAKLIGDADERAKFLMQFKPGDAKFYLKDTYIVGSKEFLEAMGATDLQISTGRARTPIVETQEDTGHTYTGLVKKGTPVCVESERIDLSDDFGEKTGQMTVWSTKADVKMDDPVTGELKDYGDQNVGYFKTSQPVSAGVYVLAELKPPAGYARSKPVAIEVYSDQTSYYVDGDMYAKVAAVRYEGNLLTDIPYEK